MRNWYLGMAAVAMAIGCSHGNTVQRTETATRDVGRGVAQGAESATNEVKCGARDVGQRLAGTHGAGDLRAEEIQRRDCERARMEAQQAEAQFRAAGGELRNNGGGKADLNRNNVESTPAGSHGGGPKR